MSDNTHQELAADMARWREQLAASRNVAVHGLENCEGMPVPYRYNLLASAVREIRGLVRPEPGTAGFLEEKSWYESTSPHLKDVLRREGILPPADLPPVNLPTGADGVEAGKKPWSVCSLVDLPGIGIEFSQFHTDKYFKFVCWWHNAETKEGHVYEVTVREWDIPAVSADVPRWRALGQADGQAIFSLESSSKRLAIECGLSAMRRYLVRGHRAAWRTWRRALQSSILNPQSSIEKEVQA